MRKLSETTRGAEWPVKSAAGLAWGPPGIDKLLWHHIQQAVLMMDDKKISGKSVISPTALEAVYPGSGVISRRGAAVGTISRALTCLEQMNWRDITAPRVR